MKFNAWQLVAILAVCLGSIVAVHVWAPGAAALVVSCILPIITALFVQRKGPDDQDPPGPSPTLKVLSGGMSVLAIGALLVACGSLSARPVAYAADLAACETKSKSWEEYTPCCTDVAQHYGRDPSFCARPADGGAK